MKKNERAKEIVICVVLGLIGIAAITCIIISMVTDKVTPYLAIGLGLTAVANPIGTLLIRKKRGTNNGSCKDGYIS